MQRLRKRGSLALAAYLIRDITVVIGRDREPLLCDGADRRFCMAVPHARVTRAPQRHADPDNDQVSLTGDVVVTVGPHGPESVTLANGYID